MMVDLAGEHQLIKKIHDGMDVHTATGEMMGVDRRTAKTINFMLLYGFILRNFDLKHLKFGAENCILLPIFMTLFLIQIQGPALTC